MKTYAEVIDYLYNQLPMFQNIGPGAYKPGLGNAHALDDAFGNPHLKFKSIHVAGTNGKGSTVHTLASVLQAQGYKVGLYTSPHLVDFRERIRINGEMISKNEVIDFMDRYQAKGLTCHPSFFELTTIMAFDYFARHNVDYACIEVGLGGRLDTTNIIRPILSIITNISLDHMALLGDTETAIAREKSGIIKEHVPVVIGEAVGDVRRVFEEKAKKMNAPVVFAQDQPVKREGNRYSIAPDSPIVADFDLVGDYQHANANTIMAAIRCLRRDVEISDEAIIKGFSTVQCATGLAGRWQTVQDFPVRVICDTGHNIGAWRILGPKLSEIKPLRIVMGFVNDKDVGHIFNLLPRQAKYYFVTPTVARGRKSEELLQLALEKGISDVKAFPSVSVGFEYALNEAAAGDTIFVGGSTYVVADFMSYIKTT